ncbi:50S ribosomal protein L10 [Liberibacter crescens]|uniref:50S ribosomal protein L10 n=1 Tax=Liberibacter crescens TaxID=1273132 RepID=UPI000316D668|nr:50S ribosomal protein L10 [Liberibacter crescens]AMC12891.1 50S ribosomal protein L10 [Liberibacter crescens]
MKRQEKQKEVMELSKIFNAYGSVVVAHYKGINVAQIKDLRAKMRMAGGCVKVSKNRLVKIAISDTSAKGISGLFKGQSLIIYSSDPVAAPKVAVRFAKDNEKFVVLGGSIGENVLDATSIEEMAMLPSLDELRAKILSAIQMNATKLVRIIKAPSSQVVRVISAYANKSE